MARIKINRLCKKCLNNKISEIRYFISDIDEKYIVEISNIIRNEWQIENCLHWYLDTVFKEDSSKIHVKNSQKNLNIIRKFCLGIIKNVKKKYNVSCEALRLILSMNFEKEIERIFKILKIS